MFLGNQVVGGYSLLLAPLQWLVRSTILIVPLSWWGQRILHSIG